MEAQNKVKILCIDDSEDVCFSLKVLFQTQKWTTYTALNVMSGLQLFKTVRPDIVLIDYHMPDINGIRGVKMLRELSPSVPIIVLTIDENQAVADAFLESGASDFALKPLKAPDLVSRIRLHLRLLQQQSLVMDKGINRSTMDLILEYLKTLGAPATIGEISQGSGLAYQTVSRYLQYMTQNNLTETESVYGKVGRPKQYYKIKQEVSET